ncbi:TetR/AcrR family transcriptional regulator [Nocardia vinacea]|uniref:TetR/AcrR family transcriptional regulator n=1 Tax=Nocardia vinacea TaxID=96468 RepID=UPI002E146823|nr:TetR/AcrR family transcriptional regulator [Nocardia vinacea]
MPDQPLEDPRKIRSRNRLLDAAAELLLSGGIEAVTIDAVTRASKVARTTLYRHFDSSTQLLAATFERLLMPPAATPTEGTLRTRLIELLHQQATFIDEVPLQLTMLAWLALSSAAANQDSAVAALRQHFLEQHRAPFDEILGDPDFAAQLGNLDLDLAPLQLVGPILTAKLVDLKRIEYSDCVRIVDDFLTARQAS